MSDDLQADIARDVALVLRVADVIAVPAESMAVPPATRTAIAEAADACRRSALLLTRLEQRWVTPRDALASVGAELDYARELLAEAWLDLLRDDDATA